MEAIGVGMTSAGDIFARYFPTLNASASEKRVVVVDSAGMRYANDSGAEYWRLRGEYAADLNALSDVGIFSGRYGPSTLNGPSDVYGAFIQIGHCQLAFGGNTLKIFARRKDSSGWSSWKSVTLS